MKYQLEKNPIWKEALEIVEYLYSILDEFPDEEKWDSLARIRSASNYLLYTIAQGIGNGSPVGAEYDWGAALKHLSGLKAICLLAYKQHFAEIEPEMLVRIDKLLAAIDAQLDASLKVAEERETKEIATWQEKYNLWKKAEDAVGKATK